MRRTLSALVAGLVLLVPACGNGDASPVEIVRAAATRTSETSSRFSMTVEVPGAQGGTITGEGAFDYGDRRGTFSIGIPGMGSVDAIMDGLVMYMRFPEQVRAEIPGGKQWIRLDLATLSEKAGVDLSALLQAQQSDPTQTLQFLRGASDDVREVGEEDVRGEPTTHYTATLDLDQAAEQLEGDARTAYEQAVKRLGTTSLPIDVWIDDEGRARRMQFTQDMSALMPGQGASGDMSFRMELFDFGVDVEAEPPPADQVADLGALLGAG